MKTLIYCCALILLCNLVACSHSPSPRSKTGSLSARASTLAPAEKKIYEQALAQLATGHYDKAEKTLHNLTQKHPGNAGIWINLANSYYQSNQLKPAQETVQHALDLNDNSVELHNIAGLVAVATGQYKAAEQHYLSALTLNNNAADVHYNLALFYDVYYQDLPKAIAHYSQYLTLVNHEDEETSAWLDELKLNLERNNNQ